MKYASPCKRGSTRGKKMHQNNRRKQSERDQRMLRIHEDDELAIEDEYVDVVKMPPQKKMPPEKATPSGLRWHVLKAGHVHCKERNREKVRGDGWIHEDEYVDVDVVKMPPQKKMPPEKVTPSGLPRHVSKAGHVHCKECKRERARGDGLGFHFCPNDEVVIEYRTKAGPIARRSARKSGLDPRMVERTG